VVKVEVAATPCGATLPNTNITTSAGDAELEHPVVALAYEIE
jgi:hypothetical protein